MDLSRWKYPSSLRRVLVLCGNRITCPTLCPLLTRLQTRCRKREAATLHCAVSKRYETLQTSLDSLVVARPSDTIPSSLPPFLPSSLPTIAFDGRNHTLDNLHFH